MLNIFNRRSKEVDQEIRKNDAVTVPNDRRPFYSEDDKRWLAAVTAGKNPPKSLRTFFNNGKGCVMGYGALNKDDAVLLSMNSGKTGLFRVWKSEAYKDFGATCFNARLEDMGLYWQGSKLAL